MNDFKKLLAQLQLQHSPEVQIPTTTPVMDDSYNDLAGQEESYVEPKSAPAPSAPGFADVLSQFGKNAPPQIKIPTTDTPAIPQDYNKLASEEQYVDTKAPSRAPAGNSSSSETMTKTSNSISGTRPSQDSSEAPKAPEAPEARLERLMKELKTQRDASAQDAASREMKANILKGLVDNAGNIVGGATAMNTHAAVNPVQVKGYDIGDLVGKVDKRYAGDTAALMEQYKQLLKSKDQAANERYRQDSLNIQREGNRIKEKAADQKVNNMKEELTPGQEAQDKDFGKKNNEWTTMGRSKFASNLKKLEDVAAELEKLPESDKDSDDRFIGALPDMFQTEADKNRREMVRAAAQETLRATLGAQFTEKEGAAIMNRAYDPTISPRSNLKRIQSVINELKQSRDANDARSKEFEAKGTLSKLQTSGTRSPAENTISNVEGKYGPEVVKDGKTYKWNPAVGKYQLK